MMQPAIKSRDADVETQVSDQEIYDHAVFELSKLISNRRSKMTPNDVRDLITGVCIDLRTSKLPRLLAETLSSAKEAGRKAEGESSTNRRYFTTAENLIGSINRADAS